MKTDGPILDATTNAVLWLIEKQGYRIVATATQLKAAHDGTGETFIVNGDEPYANACEFAQKIGIEFEDG